AVVADVDVAVADADVPRGLGIDAVGVRRIRRVDDADAGDPDVIAEQGVHGPGGGVAQRHARDLDAAALVQTDEGGARQVQRTGAERVPPRGAAAVDLAATGDRDVGGAARVDARRVDRGGGALPAGADRRVEGGVGDEAQHRPRLEVELDVRAQAQRTGLVDAGRDRDAPAAGVRGPVDGVLEGARRALHASGTDPGVHALHLRSQPWLSSLLRTKR